MYVRVNCQGISHEIRTSSSIDSQIDPASSVAGRKDPASVAPLLGGEGGGERERERETAEGKYGRGSRIR